MFSKYKDMQRENTERDFLLKGTLEDTTGGTVHYFLFVLWARANYLTY